MSSDYWKGVGSRLFSLGKTVFEKAAPIAIDVAVTAAIEKACSVIEEKLNQTYVKTAINSAITLAVNIAGLLIVILKPFGEVASSYIGSVFFVGGFVFWIVRTVLFWKKNGKMIFQISKDIIHDKSVSKGIETYIKTEIPAVSLAYSGIEIASRFLPALDRIPKIPETVKYFIKNFWKRIALFGGIVAAYSISVYWILKPFLLKSVGGLSWYQIYFYPIYHTIQLIIK